MKTANTIKTLLTAAICAVFVASCVPAKSRPGKTVSPGDEKAVPRKEAAPDQVAAVTRPAAPADRGIDEEMSFADSLRRVEFEQIEVDEHLRKPDIPIEPPVMKPVAGGKARIYLQRAFMDDAVAGLLRLNPFDAGGHGKRVFMVTDSTHRRLEFTLTGEIRRANGRKATALDFIEIWSRFITSRPAQGLAMFRNVQGAEEFVNGKNPLVNGFSAADENTIRIRLGKADPLAFHRMNTPKLIGGPFMLGPYYAGGTKDDEARLLPNANTLSDAALLAECIVQMGGDPNAMASFAQGKYSAMTLYKSSDLAVARTELRDKATLHKLPSDRYFLACKPSTDERVRSFVRSTVDGAEMLKNVIGAEGKAINSVSTNLDTPVTPEDVHTPQLAKPFKIIYREDDPISKAAAEKTAAGLSAAGMAAEAAGNSAENYEKALVRGLYDCAVGWVPEDILENLTEQLHLASMWFADDTDALARLGDFREIPLFSVNNYLLLREDMKLYGDRLSGMWVDAAAETREER
ncbi:MAG: hypothetical protein FWB94_04935 [Chitinispirillia bacterium]|nr:hypothetical protein [Chitinispirillia bacterium]